MFDVAHGMEELNPESQQRREIFAYHGLAMYHAQCVEKSLAILASSVFNKEFWKSDYTRRGEIQDKMYSEAIGKLLTRLRKKVTISDELDSLLEDARKKRNWLAHDYFFVRAGQVMTVKGRDIMIAELSELVDFFTNLDARLMAICDKWCEKVGISQESIQKSIEELIQEHE